MKDTELTKQAEVSYWNERRRAHPLDEIRVEAVEKYLLQPCFETGSDRYSDNKRAFHDVLNRCWRGRHVLDYACGTGDWAVYFALTGASRVSGFDISDVSIAMGRERLVKQGLADKVELRVMDATNLDYPDETFDVVVGHAALHHVIKYPNVFEELHRVMKKGAKAYFLEGLADFPIWRLWWKVKGEVPDGDVPIFSDEIKRLASGFSDVEVIGDTFFFAPKVFLWKRDGGLLRRTLLRSLRDLDRVAFGLVPSLRRWGSFSYIVLTK
jgi:ubiquinone/menaquinone biosynthesis C-methylase UbiE